VSDCFLDASALVKRYITEAGSKWVSQLTDPAAKNAILIAEITMAEVAAALAAKHRAVTGITQQQRDRALSRFLQDCNEPFLLLPVNRTVFARAVRLTQNYRLRGYDAVQLATALLNTEALATRGLASPVFIASDQDLLAAAKAENLPTDNPLNHTDLD
jgi:predicted nucleic acid-binding protein